MVLHRRRTALATKIAAIVATTLLAACTTLGPDYEEPEVEWLQHWQSDLYGQAGQAQHDEVDLRFWWRTFNDPILNGLIDTARRENPSLRIAGLRILEARAALGIAGSTRYPQLQQIGAGATYVDRREKDGSSGDRDVDYTAYRASLDVVWELDFWGRFQRGIESAQAGFFASITNQQDVQVLLAAQVADLYYGYRTTLLRIDIARNNASIQKRSLEITERLHSSGQESELDLQQAKALYLGTLAVIPELEGTAVRLRNALAALLARKPGDVPELDGIKGPLPTVTPVAIGDVPAKLLMRRRDVRTAAWTVAAQSAQIGIAQADLYPSISLLGSLSWTSDTLSGSPSVRGFSVGPALTWNIFDYGRIRNNVRLQDARLQQAIEGFQNSALQAAREIDDAAVTVVKTGQQQAPLSGAARAAERSLSLATTQYQEGYADFERVLDAQRVLFTQMERELLNQGAHISAVITLYKAVGGGWVDMTSEQMLSERVRDTMESRTNWGDLLTAPLPTDPQAPPPERNGGAK